MIRKIGKLPFNGRHLWSASHNFGRTQGLEGPFDGLICDSRGRNDAFNCATKYVGSQS